MIRQNPPPRGVTGDYDWTGLVFSNTSINYDPPPGSPSDQTMYGSDGHYVEPVGGDGGKASATLDLHGTSTWKWLWTPPTINGVQATLDQVPAQPLSVLGKISGGAATWVGTSGNANEGLAGSGFFDDGFGGHYTLSFPGYAPVDSSTMPGRKLIQATLQADQKTATVQMSPSAHVELAGGQRGPSGYPSRGGGRAYGNAQVYQEVHPVLLSSPSPLGHPEMGDGTNQYVYDTNPVSGLSTPGWVSVSSASLADMNWAAPNVRLNTDIDGEQSWNWSVTAGSLQPNLVNPNPNGIVYTSNQLLFLGLPFTNSLIGDHTVTLKVNGGDAGTANIQTFFPASASNHPVDANDNSFGGGPTPNWYHYYNQVYAATGYYDPYNGSSYTEGIGNYTIHISNQAWNSGNAYPVRVHHYTPGAQYVQLAGTLDCPGIFNYIWTCTHEKGHQNVQNDPTIYATATHGLDRDPDNIGNFVGDNIDDAWETAHHLNPRDRDTTHAYNYDTNGNWVANGIDIGDREYLADVQTLGILLGSRSMWRQDWADTGIQKTLVPHSVFFSVPDQNGKLDFSFTFHPYIYNIHGTPVLDQMAQPIQVKSLDELETKLNDPYILTGY